MMLSTEIMKVSPEMLNALRDAICKQRISQDEALSIIPWGSFCSFLRCRFALASAANSNGRFSDAELVGL